MSEHTSRAETPGAVQASYMAGHGRRSPFDLHRRSLLRWGGVTLAAGLPQMLGLGGRSASAAMKVNPHATADQVLFLWMPGGVTHHESFDPNPKRLRRFVVRSPPSKRICRASASPTPCPTWRGTWTRSR